MTSLKRHMPLDTWHQSANEIDLDDDDDIQFLGSSQASQQSCSQEAVRSASLRSPVSPLLPNSQNIFEEGPSKKKRRIESSSADNADVTAFGQNNFVISAPGASSQSTQRQPQSREISNSIIGQRQASAAAAASNVPGTAASSTAAAASSGLPQPARVIPGRTDPLDVANYKPTRSPSEKFEREVTFREVMMLFCCLVAAKGQQKLQVLNTFFRRLQEKCMALGYVKVDYLLFLRLLMPDQDRRQYRVKESKIADAYIRFLQLNPQKSTTAKALKNWKNNQFNNFGTKSTSKSVCFSDTVFDVMKQRVGAENVDLRSGYGGNNDYSAQSQSSQAHPHHQAGNHKPVTVQELNGLLDAVAAAADSDKVERFIDVIRRCTVSEQRWLVKIVLKDLKIQLGYEAILKEFHPDALGVFRATTSLESVCTQCQIGRQMQIRAADLISPGAKLQPMLAARLTKGDELGVILKENYVCEPKFDGERILVHIDRSKSPSVQIITRKGTDLTSSYGKFINLGVIERIKCKSCILDGEMLIWDPENKCFRSFGANRAFGVSDTSDSKENFCYFCFDVIYLDGKLLIDYTLSERRTILHKVIPQQVEHKLEIVQQTPVQTSQDVFDKLEEAMNRGEEGIIIKACNSKYGLDERNKHWIKIKPDNIDGMGETFDLVIIAGYYGTKFGKRSISHFLLGVPDKDDPSVFRSFAKVGSGYTEKELEIIQNKLKDQWKPYSSRNKPAFFGVWEPNSGERPDVYIDFEIKGNQSLVVEVKASEIVDSDKFSLGKTLRFPRFFKIRHDKDIKSCTSMTEIEDIAESVRKGTRFLFSQGTLTMIRTDDERRNDIRGKPSGSKKTSVINPLIDTSKVQTISSLFNGKTFSLFHNDPQLQERIVQQQGKVIANPIGDNVIILCDKPDCFKASNYIQSAAKREARYDIVRPTWIDDCIKEKRLVPLHPRYMIYTTKATQAFFSKAIDPYGDSYTEDVDIEQLRVALAKAKGSAQFRPVAANRSTAQAYCQRYPGIRQALNCYFAGQIAYFDMYARIGTEQTAVADSPLLISAQLFRVHGGITTCNPGEATHIIVEDNIDISRLTILERKRKPAALVLKRAWVNFVIEAAEKDQRSQQDLNSSIEDVDAAVSRHVTNPPVHYYAVKTDMLPQSFLGTFDAADDDGYDSAPDNDEDKEDEEDNE